MVSEFDLIRQYFTRRPRHTELGVGDDGALIRPSADCELVISTDLLVEGTHFFSDVDPESLGWKVLAVNLSDMAAMGATPRWATLGCVLHASADNGVSPAPTGMHSASTAWLSSFSRGFFSCADRFEVDLIGGDTTRGRAGGTTFSVTIIGEVPCGEALRRSGAQFGDQLWVSGSPGRAAMGLAHLSGTTTLAGTALVECLNALHRPTPRVELGLALRNIATAAIDVSDGLLADLAHLLTASGKSAKLEIAGLPGPGLWRDGFLSGGDDYELVFAAPADRAPEIAALSDLLSLPLHQIGSVGDDQAGSLTITNSDGLDITPVRRGFEHFGEVGSQA